MSMQILPFAIHHNLQEVIIGMESIALVFALMPWLSLTHTQRSLKYILTIFVSTHPKTRIIPSQRERERRAQQKFQLQHQPFIPQKYIPHTQKQKDNIQK